MNQHYVFGYGTLQHTRDMKNFDFQLKHFGAEYVGDGILRDHMIARVPCGRLWAGVIQHPGGYVQGEVWACDDAMMDVLDRREGTRFNPPVYKREMKRVEIAGALIVEAWVYTVDHNPLTVRTHLTHSWPVAGISADEDTHVPFIRTHAPLVEAP